MLAPCTLCLCKPHRRRYAGSAEPGPTHNLIVAATHPNPAGPYGGLDLVKATEEVPDAEDEGGEGVGDDEGWRDVHALDAKVGPVAERQHLEQK